MPSLRLLPAFARWQPVVLEFSESDLEAAIINQIEHIVRFAWLM